MLLLTLGIGWGSAPAIAADNVAIDQLQASCKPMTDAELGQVRGKLLGQANFDCDFGKLARCFFNKLPEDTQERICKVVQIIRCLSSCKRDGGNNVAVSYQ